MKVDWWDDRSSVPFEITLQVGGFSNLCSLSTNPGENYSQNPRKIAVYLLGNATSSSLGERKEGNKQRKKWEIWEGKEAALEVL